jgi:ribosomal protein S1
VTGQDDRGKIKLSMKQVDQETGEKIAQESLRDAS